MFYTQAPKTGGPHTRRGQVRRPPAQHRTAPEPRCPQLTGPGTLPLLPPPPPHEQGVGCTMLGAPSRCGVHADFHGTYVREPPAYPNSYVPRAGTTLALEGIAVATVVAASLMDFTVAERNCQITPYMGSFSAYFSPTPLRGAPVATSVGRCGNCGLSSIKSARVDSRAPAFVGCVSS